MPLLSGTLGFAQLFLKWPPAKTVLVHVSISDPDRNIDKWKFTAVLLGQTKTSGIWDEVVIKENLPPDVTGEDFHLGAKEFLPGAN